MNSAQILVVDNDPAAADQIRSILTAEGHPAHILHDGSTVLELLKKRSVEPQMILLGVELPGQSGFEICESLQEDSELALIPVVMLTASSQAESRLQAFQLGAVGFLTKPIVAELLLDQVSKALEVRRQWESRFDSAQKATTLPIKADIQEPTPLPQFAGAEPSSQALSLATDEPSLPGFPQAEGRQVSFSDFIRLLSSHLDKEIPATTTPHNLYEMAAAHGINERHLAGTLSRYTGLPLMADIPSEQIRLGVLPVPFCRKYSVVPFQTADQELGFAMTHPFTMEVEDALMAHRQAPRFIVAPEVIQRLFTDQQAPDTKAKIKAKTGKMDAVDDIVDELHTQYQPAAPKAAEVEELELDDYASAPMIRLVNRLIIEAYQLHASDIHIEAWEDAVAVRYRVDGILRDYHMLKPLQLIQPLSARIKIMSNLNIAERRLPQDGRIVFSKHNRQNLDFDLRVAIAPMNYGEKIVMRLIDKQKSMLPLEDLGFSKRNLELYRTLIQSPYGMVLHVGPTGSGKSMTLYSALNEINSPDINIQTAEDPIEYTLPRINQLQVNADNGQTFARALRAYLRQDPDVLLVGEIRDQETAHTAIEAALTGHLLLSTMHTNDAASTLTRFIEMGIAPFMISPSVIMICAQRLVRRLCRHCREPYTPNPSEKQQLGLTGSQAVLLYQPGGCEQCNGTGFKGRVGVHELLIPTERIRAALSQPGMTADQLKQIAVQEGMVTLYWDAMDKVQQGMTSLNEALSHVKPDEFDSKPKPAN